jgi:hypothetical protein
MAQGLPDELHESAALQLLSNSLILGHIAPYLPVSDLLNLSASCRTLRYFVTKAPHLLRRLDLTPFKSAQFEIEGIDRGGETWRNVQLDENLTEDELSNLASFVRLVQFGLTESYSQLLLGTPTWHLL